MSGSCHCPLSQPEKLRVKFRVQGPSPVAGVATKGGWPAGTEERLGIFGTGSRLCLELQGCLWKWSHALRQAALGEELWMGFPSPRLSFPICKWKGQVTWSPSSAVPARGPSWPSLLPTLGSQSHLVVTASVLCRPQQGLLLGVTFCGSATWAACFCQWGKIE